LIKKRVVVFRGDTEKWLKNRQFLCHTVPGCAAAAAIKIADGPLFSISMPDFSLTLQAPNIGRKKITKIPSCRTYAT